MGPKPKSVVWNYFIKTETGATCKICSQEVKSKGNTTNLKFHLDRSHSEMTYETEKIAETNKRKHVTQFGNETDEYDDEEQASSPARSTSTTSGISAVVTKAKQPRLDIAFSG